MERPWQSQRAQQVPQRGLPGGPVCEADAPQLGLLSVLISTACFAFYVSPPLFGPAFQMSCSPRTHAPGPHSLQAKFAMQMVYNRSIFLDKQLMKMQENPNEIPEGETPHTVSMFARQVGEGGKPARAGKRHSAHVSRLPLRPALPAKLLSPYHRHAPLYPAFPPCRTWWTWPSRATASP